MEILECHVLAMNRDTGVPGVNFPSWELPAGGTAESPCLGLSSSIPTRLHHLGPLHPTTKAPRAPFCPQLLFHTAWGRKQTQNQGSAALLDSPWLKGCLEAKRNETLGIGQVSLLSVWKLNIKPKNFPGADMNPDIILLCRYGKIQPAIFNFLDVQATGFSFRVGKQR